jgi:hypothetical protein
MPIAICTTENPTLSAMELRSVLPTLAGLSVVALPVVFRTI